MIHFAMGLKLYLEEMILFWVGHSWETMKLCLIILQILFHLPKLIVQQINFTRQFFIRFW